jgi:ABC-type Fe3+/spermidine/putrescine transport system ATPase subunit
VTALTVTLETRLKEFMLSLDFEMGDELLALVGRAGSGKTVILRSIAGVYVPDSGSIAIRGESVFSTGLGVAVPPGERHVGYVPQAHQLFPHLTVEENVGFTLTRPRDLTPEQRHNAERRVQELLELLQLTRIADVLPVDLNELEFQRAALGRALAGDPEILLLDDPFASLDSSSRRQARSEFAELRKLINVPVLLATTELEEAYEIADRIALIDQGSLLQISPPRQLLMRPANRRVAEIVRSVNVIPGTVIATTGETIEVSTPLGILRVSDLSGIHGEVDVVVRPEHVRPLERTESVDGPDATNILHGIVTGDVRHGTIHAMTFKPDDAYHDVELQLFVSDLAYQQLELAADQHRSVELPPRALHLMPRSGESGSDDG